MSEFNIKILGTNKPNKKVIRIEVDIADLEKWKEFLNNNNLDFKEPKYNF